MKLKSIYRLAFLGSLVAIAGCSGDDLDGVSSGSVPESVAVTLTVARPGDASTRTVLTDNNDGTLTSKWTAGDKLLVVTSDGIKAGELTLLSGENTITGVFTGDLAIADGTHATLWYLGASNGDAAPYTCATGSTGDKVTLTTDLSGKEGSPKLGVSFDDLKRAELLTEDDVEFTVKGGKGYVKTEGITLDQKMAMAHFSLIFPGDFAVSDGATLKVNSEKGDLPNVKTWLPANSAAEASYGYTFTIGDGKDIQISNNTADLYIPIIPGSYKLKFEVTSGSKQYSYSLTEESQISAGVYYTCGAPSYAGIKVELSEPKTPDPNPADDDLIGGVFEVNGKKFRFTKANLKYDIANDKWSLFDEQYQFINRAGWADKNGNYMPTIGKKVGNSMKDFALPPYADIIDCFGFGATGLYDYESGETAQYPQFFRQTKIQTQDQANYYYPTNNTDYNKGSGYTGSYLEAGIQFTAFDWGYAYYLSKNSEDKPSVDHPYTSYDPDPLNGSNPVYRYFTLTTSDWTAIKNKYFIAACTILNAGNTVDKDSKGNIYGCLIFPIVADADIRDVQILKDRNKNEKVIAMLNKVDGITTTNKVKTIENLSFTTTSGPTYFNADWIKMTVEQFKQLEAMGVVFLPQAGYRAEESLATKSGYYWTATAGQDRTSTIFRFDGNLSTKEFKLDSQIARSLGCSVRLVKEVPEDYKDPFAD